MRFSLKYWRDVWVLHDALLAEVMILKDGFQDQRALALCVELNREPGQKRGELWVRL